MRNVARKQAEVKGKVTPLPRAQKIPVQKPSIKRKKPYIYMLTLLLVYFLILFSSQLVRYIQLSNELKDLSMDIVAIQEENIALEAEIEKLHDLEYLEELARGRLGLVKQGEILFYIRDMDSEN